MRTFHAVSLLAALALLASPGSRLWANVVPPSGLAAGSQYQLIFVTAGARNAVDDEIDPYNTFVTTQAAQGVPFGLPSGLTWSAVASTEDGVDANFNAPSGTLPVYNTAGQRVAGPSVGIYTGVLENLVAYDQFGDFAFVAQEENVWTGSDDQGFGIAGATLGDSSGDSEIGRLALDTTWLEFDTAPQVNEVVLSKPLYALSSPITVPVPEPGAIVLLASALCLLGVWQLAGWRGRFSRAGA